LAVHDEAFPGAATAAAAERTGVVRHLPIPDNDAVLVEAIRAGRGGAAAALFDRHAPHVRRVLVRVLGVDRDLPDLVQEVFVQVLESLDRLQQPKALRGWITSIAVFVARAHIRKKKRQQLFRFFAPSDIEEFVTAPDGTSHSEAVRSVYRVMAHLSADERIAFALRFVDGMELTEVAAACRVSLATIKRRLASAQRKFAEEARRHPELVPWLSGGGRWAQ